MSLSYLIIDHFNSLLSPIPERIYNLKGSLLPLFLTLIKENFLLITKTEEDCEKILKDYDFYKRIFGGSNLSHFPDSEDYVSSAKQIEVILNADESTSIITSLNAFKRQIKSIDELKKEIILLKTSEEVSRDNLIERLNSIGYRPVSMVVDKGEFSIRNYILDLYPTDRDEPIRIEFFGDEIESIRQFSVNTQRTVGVIDEVLLFPLKQTDGSKSILDIIDFTHLFCLENVSSELLNSNFEFNNSSETTNHQSPITNHRSYTVLSHLPIGGEGIDGGAISISGKGIYPEDRKSIKGFTLSIAKLKQKNLVIIVCPSTAQGERIKDILMENDVVAPLVGSEGIGDFTNGIFITTGMLSEGVFIPKLLILTDREIFGDIHLHRSIKKSHVADLIQSMDDLNEGDYVVHDLHGIGIFEGLREENADGFMTDMLIINYSENARLYLPVYGINSIKKYRAEEGVIPAVDKLGGKTWQKKKNRVRSKVKIAAEKLMKHYAERETISGLSFSEDTDIHREFDNFFLYEETPDQLSAINDIKSDIESSTPMDRLLCGDVGYGKTEVAMRASFKVVYDGMKVAILVPTTVLCEQHFFTLKERFSAFPVSIDYISRFKSRKEINGTLNKFSKGEIDIIIATHGLLKKGIKLPNLGLLVIDEEHRFGVGQKERIKELKKNVDCLSLSATPIPRTLQMALSGIWNMSLINTPPEERLSVRTFCLTFNKSIIKEALERELSRGGQVFFVHNRIRSIEPMADMVRSLVPNATVETAHGQMKERELEDIMIAFMKSKIDVLVSTSIIGSGLDIPNANTIIINRADKLGLSDLYQLRGRVGRGNVRAYAYLFVPGEDIITEQAKKRLTAIQEMSYLGAGLRLAMKDLEIRGAGNLLGAEQSGHIHAVGFDTYMEMLEKEISKHKGVDHKEEIEPKIDLKIEAIVPGSYIENVSLRLNFYRRIAAAKEEEDLFSLKDEMLDRFGKVPDVVENLFNVMRLKLLCRKLMVISFKQFASRVQIIFSDSTPVSTERLLKLPEILDEDVKFLERGLELYVKDLDIRFIIDIFKSL